MKKLIILLVAAIVVLGVFWLLPWWVSLGLIAIVVMPVLVIVVAFFAVIRSVKSEFASAFPELVPKKKSSKLAAGETFRGSGFSFSFPVACEVSQTTLDDFEALMLKPKIHAKGQPGDSMLIVSTIPKDEMKTGVTAKLDDIFSKIDELRTSEFEPLAIGSLSGEHRTFEASKDGKSLRGESAYLGIDGDDEYSVAWQIITERDAFDAVAARYRELARLVTRVDTT